MGFAETGFFTSPFDPASTSSFHRRGFGFGLTHSSDNLLFKMIPGRRFRCARTRSASHEINGV
jgi:hypothetical protein